MIVKTLYKQNRGKIQVWSIELEEDKYRTTEGFEGGAMTTSKWTVAQPKNVGKKNQTTGETQAGQEVNAKVQKKLEKGYTDSRDKILLMERFEPMLAKEYSKNISKVEFYTQGKYYVQPKLDGMRCYINKEGMFSRQHKPIVSAPHIFNSVKHIFEKYPNIVLDGELYNHDLKEDFNKIISLVKKVKPSASELADSQKYIQYHVYDCYLGDNKADILFDDRYRSLEDLTQDLQYVVLVDTTVVRDVSQIDGEYAYYLEEGYEGMMIRANVAYEQKRTSALLKRKEFLDSEYKVVDVIEGVGNRSGMLGNFLLETPEGKQFGSNARGNEEYYKETLQNKHLYIGKLANVRYQNLTPDGIPRFPVVTSIRDYD